MSVLLLPYFCLILAIIKLREPGILKQDSYKPYPREPDNGDASRMDENRLHVAIKGRRDTLLAWVENSPILVRYSLSLTVKSVIVYNSP